MNTATSRDKTCSPLERSILDMSNMARPWSFDPWQAPIRQHPTT